MSAVVLDASFTFQWLFKNEALPESEECLRQINFGEVLVPALWHVEITNGVGMASRRERITQQELPGVFGLLRTLPIVVDQPPLQRWRVDILALMQIHRLTAYDASYLEIARRRQTLLATKDQQLAAVAALEGVRLFALA